MNRELAASRITIDRDICDGRPCIRGLRIRVKDILELLAGGATREQVLADYPYLEDEDITAALDYAARQLVDQHREFFLEKWNACFSGNK